MMKKCLLNCIILNSGLSRRILCNQSKSVVRERGVDVMKALAIVGVLLGVLLLFALCLLFRAFDDPRTLAVDLSQAVIELVGLAALGFAIYEFRASQQKPKLELWGLSKQEASDRRFFEKKRSLRSAECFQ